MVLDAGPPVAGVEQEDEAAGGEATEAADTGVEGPVERVGGTLRRRAELATRAHGVQDDRGGDQRDCGQIHAEP